MVIPNIIGRTIHTSVTTTPAKVFTSTPPGLSNSGCGISVKNHSVTAYLFIHFTMIDASAPSIDATHHIVMVNPSETRDIMVGTNIQLWLAASTGTVDFSAMEWFA